MIRFFQLLTTPPNETSITQELLSLVTGLAQNLKSLIRIGLSAALNLVRNFPPSFFFIYIKRQESNKTMKGHPIHYFHTHTRIQERASLNFNILFFFYHVKPQGTRLSC